MVMSNVIGFESFWKWLPMALIKALGTIAVKLVPGIIVAVFFLMVSAGWEVFQLVGKKEKAIDIA